MISRSCEAAQEDDDACGILISTNDLKRRFSSHQSGHILSTRAYLPAQLKSYIAVETEAHAREREAYFKTGSGKAIALKRLIRTNKSVQGL